MADLSTLTLAARADIADSLADAAENLRNAAEASDGNAADAFSNTADRYDTILEFFLAGRDLDEADLALVRTALDSSVENCDELGLDDAMAGYESALEELDGLV